MKLTTKIKKAPTSTSAPGQRQTTGTATVMKASATPAGSASRQITTESIASRAYALWEQAGRPLGRDVEYWLQAESQLKADAQSFLA
jgi:hypothetical protein